MSRGIQDAIILAGGLGTRLLPLTQNTPKALLPIFGRPFIETQFWSLRRAGVRRVRLSLGHQAAPMLTALPRLKKFGLKVSAVRERRPLGTGGAIRNAWIDKARPCLALNGDVLTDLDLRPLARAHVHSGACATLQVLKVDDPSRYGRIRLGAKGNIVQFLEKARDTTPGLINAGLYALDPRILSYLPLAGPVSVEKKVFPALIQAGEKIDGFRGAGQNAPYWRDIGTLESYVRANLDASLGRVKLRGFWT